MGRGADCNKLVLNAPTGNEPPDEGEFNEVEEDPEPPKDTPRPTVASLEPDSERRNCGEAGGGNTVMIEGEVCDKGGTGGVGTEVLEGGWALSTPMDIILEPDNDDDGDDDDHGEVVHAVKRA